MRQRKEEARAEQTITEDDSDTGRCPQPSPLAHLPGRDPKADVFHCCDAFVREVVDLGEVLELHHVEVSFARLHPAPLCLDIPVLHSCRWQKGGFAMDSLKQEPGEDREGITLQQEPPVGIESWEPPCEIPGCAHNTQIYSFYSLLPFAPPSILFLPVFSPSFSANILGRSRSCFMDTLLIQGTGMFSLPSVCTQGRGDRESQTEEVVSGIAALTKG